jgi:hypothetical protein
LSKKEPPPPPRKERKKRPYQRPTIVSSEAFTTRALGCLKDPDSQCEDAQRCFT